MIMRCFSFIFFAYLSLFSLEKNLFETLKHLYTNYGNNQYMIGEKITQKDYALQAAFIAKKCKASDEIVLALLLHDIGQLINSENIGKTILLHLFHDEVGFKWLKEQGFSNFVCDFAKFHTLAKIVLCEIDPNYYGSLSSASKQSCHLQNVKFSKKEHQSTFELFLSHPRLQEFLFARRCDDAAKIQDKNFIVQ